MTVTEQILSYSAYNLEFHSIRVFATHTATIKYEVPMGLKHTFKIIIK